MSKPVSNAEIEDVLSSIRRLVSENAGAQRRDRPGSDRRDRLVLTPDFRVDGTARAPVQDEADTRSEGADSEHEAGASSDDADDGDMDAAVAILAERLSAANIIPEHAPQSPAPETPLADSGPDSGAQEEQAAETRIDTPEDTAPENTAPDSTVTDDTVTGDAVVEDAVVEDAVAEIIDDAEGDEARSLELRIAELEAAVDNTAGEWEPDGSEAEDTPDQAVFHHHAAHISDVAREQPGDDGTKADDSVSSPAHSPEHDPGNSVDDTPTADAFDGDPWEDVVVARPDDAHAFGDDDIDDAEVLEEESVIDEAILRDYVAQMVREELQGPIGERITHNVRRMVRREIARALALRDMD